MAWEAVQRFAGPRAGRDWPYEAGSFSLAAQNPSAIPASSR